MKAWEKNIRTVEPYVPGEQPKELNIIKLNTNENPYPPAPQVVEYSKTVSVDLLKLYPDPAASELVDALAKAHGVKNTQVFPGVGSDDVLAMVFLTFFNSELPVLFPDITYSFYSVWADVYRIPFVKIPLNENFRINTEDYYRENGGIVIANPNAPTGIAIGLEEIEKILQNNQDSIVVIDEAYADFCGITALPLLDRYENLIIVRTFSKSKSLAGLRIGYAIASERLIKALNDVKYSINSYTLNKYAIELGRVAVENQDYYDMVNQKVINTRERFIKEASELGFECLPSGTNFVFARHNSVAGQTIFDELKKAGIFVRHFNGERIKDFLRITIGTDEQMDTLLDFLRNYLK